MIVDTTLLVDLIREDPDAHRWVRSADEGPDPLHVPAPALFELWEGVERSDWPHREQERVEGVLNDFPILHLEPRHVKRAGRLSGRLVRQGEMVDPLDLLVAGTALEEGVGVVTRNARHFDRVPELDVVTY